MSLSTSPAAQDAPHSSDDAHDTIASSPTHIISHEAHHSTTMFPNSDDTFSSGPEELTSAHPVLHPSSEYAISPRVSTVGTDDSHGQKPQFSVAPQIIQDFSAPGLDSLHWAGVQRQRGDFDQRSVASSMNAEKDAASVYELHLGEDELVGPGSVRRTSVGAPLARRDSIDEHDDGDDGARGADRDGHHDEDGGQSRGDGSLGAHVSQQNGQGAKQVSVRLDVDAEGKAVMRVGVAEEDSARLGGGETAATGHSQDVQGMQGMQDMDITGDAGGRVDRGGMQSSLDLIRTRTMTRGESSAPEATDESEGGRGSDDESEEELPESPSTNWVVSGGMGLGGGNNASADEEGDRTDEIEFHPGQSQRSSIEVVEELSLRIGGVGLGHEVVSNEDVGGVEDKVDVDEEEGEDEEEVVEVEVEVTETVEVVLEGPGVGHADEEEVVVATKPRVSADPSAGSSQTPASSQPARVDMGPEWEDTFKGLLYEDGMDALGRPVVVLDADAIPPRMRSSAVTYVRTHLEPIVNAGDYVIVFTAKKATLPTFWILGAYQSLPRPFRKNVQYIILVKPSRFLRAILAFMRPFVSSKAARKIKLIESVEEIEVATEREVTQSSLGSFIPQ